MNCSSINMPGAFAQNHFCLPGQSCAAENSLITRVEEALKPVENNLDPSIDQEKVIFGPESKRKKHNKHKIKMPDDGTCPFSGCQWINKSRKLSTAQMHISRLHSFEAGYSAHSYMCGKCKITFKGRSHLNHHNANHHNAHKFGCPQCDYTAATKLSAASHIMRKHEKWFDAACVNAKNECVNCSKKLARTGHMNHLAKCLGITATVVLIEPEETRKDIKSEDDEEDDEEVIVWVGNN
jgi:hypothetical protein